MIEASEQALFSYPKEDDMKHALYSGNAAVYDDMEMSAKSLVANSDVDRIYFLIDDAEFPRELPDMIECIDVRKQKYFPKDGANIKTKFSYMSLMRAALALMPELRNIDRIVSLDCDTVAVKNVSELWDMPVDDCYFSASSEPPRNKNGLLYCNTGVALYNLEKLRDGKAEEVVDVLNKRAYVNIEQDVFSYLCQGRIHDMPSEYNATKWTKRCSFPRLVHYAGIKGDVWRNYAEPHEYRNMTWDEALELHRNHFGK